METAHESGFIWRPLLLAASSVARADDFACVSTTFNLLTPNDKVCVSDFDDPKVPGVTCFFSQARKGSWGQPFGLNEDPSNLSVSCRQLGPIATDLSTLPKYEEAFTEKTSIFFKKAHLSHAGQRPPHADLSCRELQAHQRSPANSISVQPGHGDVQHPDQGEAERQQEQEIDVVPGDHQPQGS
jgi:CreA protein